MVQRHLAPVGAPEGQHLQKLDLGTALDMQPRGDAPRLAVEGERRAGGDVEHHYADRAGLDQRLQVGPGLPLCAVRPGVDDGRRRLLREQHQRLLVRVGEPALAPAQEEAADIVLAAAHRRRLERAGGDREGGEAERADMGGQVRHPQRPGEGAQVLEQRRPVGPFQQRPALVLAEAGNGEVAGRTACVGGGNDAVARAGERAGAVHGLREHGVDIEARADAQDGRAQGGVAPAGRFVESFRFCGFGHRPLLLAPGRPRDLVRTGRVRRQIIIQTFYRVKWAYSRHNSG